MDKQKDPYRKLITQWRRDEIDNTCGDQAKKHYLKNHKKRFQYIVDLCKTTNSDRSAKVLDIGRSQLSVMLSSYYKNLVTMGLPLEEDIGGHREVTPVKMEHITFDLNRSDEVDLWPNREFDLIVCSEVLEHLSIALEYVLLFFYYLLKNRGFVVCSTPNAVSLYKRIQLLLGRNPYKMIRLYEKNPGHFREFTKTELIEIGNKCGFFLVYHRFKNFAPKTESLKVNLYNRFTNFIPPFRGTQILIYQKSKLKSERVIQ